MQLLDETEALRKKYFRPFLIGLILLGVFLCGLIISFITLVQTGQIAFLGLVFPLFFLMIGAILLTTISSNKYKNLAKQRFLPAFLKTFYQDVLYEKKGNSGFINELIRTDALRRPDRTNEDDYVHAKTMSGIEFEGMDVDFMTKSTDSEGHTTYTTYFAGKAIKYYLQNEITRDFSLLISERYINSIRGLKKIETESTAFTKKFKIISDDQLATFKFLTPLMMERIEALEKKYKGQMILMLKNGYLYIFVGDTTHSFEFRITKELTGPYLETIKQQCTIFSNIIDQLGYIK
ncbi:MAG: DUF3137 domain-containing protein [Erysipelotrichaceae bacterium]|jgi:hypothetical protein|nr:DUF3137 domain-containing protein [Erysipelotrichaceae bacterium]